MICSLTVNLVCLLFILPLTLSPFTPSLPPTHSDRLVGLCEHQSGAVFGEGGEPNDQAHDAAWGAVLGVDSILAPRQEVLVVVHIRRNTVDFLSGVTVRA